mmetsp:Transcript_18563/g.46973  ORF Transcript_18563/g.46973 Transcript_18563/m.46973 type:complete len:395 (+) Transcript_18563:561-1745(+)
MTAPADSCLAALGRSQTSFRLVPCEVPRSIRERPPASSRDSCACCLETERCSRTTSQVGARPKMHRWLGLSSGISSLETTLPSFTTSSTRNASPAPAHSGAPRSGLRLRLRPRLRSSRRPSRPRSRSRSRSCRPWRGSSRRRSFLPPSPTSRTTTFSPTIASAAPALAAGPPALTPSAVPSACRQPTKPSLGSAMLRHSTTCVIAWWHVHSRLRIKYAAHRVAERLTPAPQCTSTALFRARASSMKSKLRTKCCEMSWLSTSGASILRCLMRGPGRRLSGWLWMVRMPRMLSCSSCCASAAWSQSPRYSRPGTISLGYGLLVTLALMEAVTRKGYSSAMASIPSLKYVTRAALPSLRRNSSTGWSFFRPASPYTKMCFPYQQPGLHFKAYWFLE